MNEKLIISTYSSNTSPWAMKFRYPEIIDKKKRRETSEKRVKVFGLCMCLHNKSIFASTGKPNFMFSQRERQPQENSEKSHVVWMCVGDTLRKKYNAVMPYTFIHCFVPYYTHTLTHTLLDSRASNFYRRNTKNPFKFNRSHCYCNIMALCVCVFGCASILTIER